MVKHIGAGVAIRGVRHDIVGYNNGVMREHNYYVYILTNMLNSVLYVGVTNDLQRRLQEHRMKCAPNSFASRYRLTKLVWYDHTTDVAAAIQTEKKLKNWRRAWKIALIEENNKEWKDLAEEWYEKRDAGSSPA